MENLPNAKALSRRHYPHVELRIYVLVSQATKAPDAAEVATELEKRARERAAEDTQKSKEKEAKAIFAEFESIALAYIQEEDEGEQPDINSKSTPRMPDHATFPSSPTRNENRSRRICTRLSPSKGKAELEEIRAKVEEEKLTQKLAEISLAKQCAKGDMKLVELLTTVPRSSAEPCRESTPRKSTDLRVWCLKKAYKKAVREDRIKKRREIREKKEKARKREKTMAKGLYNKMRNMENKYETENTGLEEEVNEG
ncbi:hypothetical protein RUND412_000656 [Rhizina undulata]